MIRFVRPPVAVLIALAAAMSAPGHANEMEADDRAVHPAAGLEIWSSTDSDQTDVVKLSGRALWRFEGRDVYQGITIEHARFKPQGQKVRKFERLYLELAGEAGEKWLYRAKVGTDGHTVIGSATIRSSDWSSEIFAEREIVESPRGVRDGIYYTFLGASFDIPADDRNRFNVSGGVQEFTGSNERLHVRGHYVHTIAPNLGLSGQLRARYFHSTTPGEFDYYSPKDFVQLLPVIQMRRFDKAGWMYLVALGYGVQKATATDWHSARFADLRFESPPESGKLQAFGQIQYSNNSIGGAASNYHYVMARAGLTVRF